MYSALVKCIRCGGETLVRDTRQVDDYVRRKRDCENPACKHRFWTREKIDPTARSHEVGMRGAIRY